MSVSWKKSCDKPRRRIKKQRYHFAHKGSYDQSYGFSSIIFMWELGHKECWVQKLDAFELWCWRRLWRVPWNTRSNQSILKEINSEYSQEGLMLKLQYFGYLMGRTDWLGRTLMFGKTEGKRMGQQRMRWLDDITDSMDMSLFNMNNMFVQHPGHSEGQGGLVCCSLGSQRIGLSNWTTAKAWYQSDDDQEFLQPMKSTNL